jgi:hypothetical protein
MTINSSTQNYGGSHEQTAMQKYLHATRMFSAQEGKWLNVGWKRVRIVVLVEITTASYQRKCRDDTATAAAA